MLSTAHVNAVSQWKKPQSHTTVTSTTSSHIQERLLFLLRTSLPFVSPKATLSHNTVIGCSKFVLPNRFPIGTRLCIDILTPWVSTVDRGKGHQHKTYVMITLRNSFTGLPNHGQLDRYTEGMRNELFCAWRHKLKSDIPTNSFYYYIRCSI